MARGAVNAGDIIQISTSGSTPNVVGIPLAVALGSTAISALAQYGVGPSIGSWNDVADDGVSIGGAFKLTGAGSNGQNAIVTAAENGPASGGGNAIGTGSNQANIDSLQMWYGKVALVSLGFDELIYRSPAGGVPLVNGLSASSPVAAAVDTAGNVVVQFHDVAGTIQKCALGNPGSCTTIGSISAYNPSYDHRGMAVGADGVLYFATASGLLRKDDINNTSATLNGTAYKQVVTSGDGHLYALRADGSGVDASP